MSSLNKHAAAMGRASQNCSVHKIRSSRIWVPNSLVARSISASISLFEVCGGGCWLLQKTYKCLPFRASSAQAFCKRNSKAEVVSWLVLTGYPPGPFVTSVMSALLSAMLPAAMLPAAMLLLLLPVVLFFLALSFAASLPACFSCRPAFLLPMLHAYELSGAHAYTVAACQVPVLRPQLQHTTSKKTAA